MMQKYKCTSYNLGYWEQVTFSIVSTQFLPFYSKNVDLPNAEFLLEMH